LLALIGAALEHSLFLLEFSQDIGGVSDDVEKFAKDIRIFAGIAKVGYCSLKSYSESQPASLLIRYFKELRIVESLAEQSRRTGKRTDLVWLRIQWVQSSSKVIT
jgi:hypothetical protein